MAAKNNDTKKQGSMIIRELSRRRVFIFAAFFVIFVLGSLIAEEGDILSHAFDDAAIFAIGLITLVFLYVSRHRHSLSELTKQHNVVFALFVLALLIQIAAIFMEMNDPQDFGNEIPSLILILLVLANRFV